MSTPSWNGSRLQHPDFAEKYGIDDGGFAEAVHVFADAVELEQRFAAGGVIRVGDLGLGAGRNLLMMWSLFHRVAPPDARLEVHTFERDPVPWTDARAALEHSWQQSPHLLQYRLQGLLERMDRLRTTWPTALPAVSALHTGDPRVRIRAWIGDVADTVPMLQEPLDHWCLDGFSPTVNPAMWAPELLQAISARTVPGGSVSTYTAAGRVRRALDEVGFDMRKADGFGRKRHMLVGSRRPEGPALVPPIGRHPPHPVRPPGRVAVIGAGIAGCSVARELAEEGIRVEVFEAREAAVGASGNPWGLLQPLPNLGASPVGDWTTRAFAWTRAWAQRRGLPWQPLRVARYGDKAEYARKLLEQLGWGDVLESPEDIDDAPTGALLGIAEAAVVPPRVWCRTLLEHPGITLRAPRAVNRLRPGWFLDDEGPFDTVILANSWSARELVPGLDLHPVRGQLLQLPATDRSVGQQRALCGPVYLLPARDGHHLLGATYHRDDPSPQLRTEDTRWLWDTLSQAVPAAAATLEPPGPPTPGRVSWRGVTPGRLPFVGPVEDPAIVARTLDPRKRTRPQYSSEAYQPGLWITAGHGSRGLSGAPFAAKVLTDRILGRTPPLPIDTLDAIHPARVSIARARG